VKRYASIRPRRIFVLVRFDGDLQADDLGAPLAQDLDDVPR
jgi:hypothetical protein